ncbi:MAG: cyanophycinase [Gemmatimonadales bacterium]
MRPLFAAGAALLLLAGGPARPSGHLLIVGGGEQPEALVRRFVELAGGPGKARIVVVPMASSEPAATGEEKAADLRALGADASVLLLTRAQAESAGSARALDQVTGIWFTGGDQVPLAEALRATPVLEAMRARYQAGAVIGGTSAGAAIMSDSMLTGNQRRPDSLGYYGDDYDGIRRDYIQIVPGLGFLHGAVVDQHFLRRERHNRLLSVVLERPTLLGVGIDEGTALEVEPDGTWLVLGRSAVMIYDARAARVTPAGATVLGTTGIRMHLLPAGSRFDPRRGTATLPRP